MINPSPTVCEVNPQARPSAPPALSLNSAILLVGPEAAALESTAHTPGLGSNTKAESFVEAILVTGQGIDYQWIIAGIGNELGHLQRAVQSLRTVCPKARLILLCQPEDEPIARRALAWGANDYQILPVTLERILTHSAAPAAPAANRLRESESQAKNPPSMTIASLPLMLNTTMMDILLQGRGDLAKRGLAILQSYLSWEGNLEFVAAADEPAEVPAQPGSARVSYRDENFGHLLLKANMNVTAAAASQLGQAAQWLGGWMAVANQTDQLRSLAITDELSGAYNRRYFQKFVTGLLEKARVQRFRVTLLLFDIDNFKTYNDRFGHAAGDAIIRQLITLLRRCTRERDLVARIGGDEFAVVFWDSEAPRQPNSQHPRDAVAATERLRQAILSHNWQDNCSIKGEVSISGGIASFPWDADNLEALLATADAALLRAKSAGKNVVLLHCGDGSQASIEQPADEMANP